MMNTKLAAFVAITAGSLLFLVASEARAFVFPFLFIASPSFPRSFLRHHNLDSTTPGLTSKSFNYHRFSVTPSSTESFSKRESTEACVGLLLQEIHHNAPNRTVIQNLMNELTLNATVEDPSPSWEPLLGYYNVSYTLAARPKDNPVGGKWTRSPTMGMRLWSVQRTLQHILPKKPPSNNIDSAAASSSTTTVNNNTAASVSTSALAVAQVVNAIRLDCLGGWLGIWVMLRGDAVPLSQGVAANSGQDDDDGDETKEGSDAEDHSASTTTTIRSRVGNSRSTPDSRPLLPGLTARTVRVYFDRPRIGLQLYGRRQRRPDQKPNNDSSVRSRSILLQSVLSLGPTSSVVIDTPYVDDWIRLGKGGTSGSQFVFSRLSEQTDVEAVGGWRWVLEGSTKKESMNGVRSCRSSALTKAKLMAGVGVWGVISTLCYKLASHAIRRQSSNVFILAWFKPFTAISAVLSSICFFWLLFSTGGIETRGDTYTRGK